MGNGRDFPVASIAKAHATLPWSGAPGRWLCCPTGARLCPLGHKPMAISPHQMAVVDRTPV